jgi:5'-3' exonuclease
MGIPSYFSYIIKNYPNIIQKLNQCEPFQHLFMDCNSIIYDAYNNLEKIKKYTQIDISLIENIILNKVVENIKAYIQYISPKNTVFITFDGVAPFAKMDQQKRRRYKSIFLENNEKIWNTTNITPGTIFMNSLSERINNEFNNKEKEYNINKIIISCSDEAGEGEHKLFQYIRDNDLKKDNIAIYGLDSDLIMLSIFHRQFVNSIFVFREAPEFKFVFSEDKLKDPNEKLFLNIGLLSQSIFNEMGSDKTMKSVNDYIFLCFFLGNDFLPHFPSFNIRTNGIQILMDTYRIIIGKYPERSLVSNNRIQWKWVALFIQEISKNENQYILNEYFIRDKMDFKIWADNTPEEKQQIFLNIPIIYRQDEKYISPNHIGWEKRYYKQLFNIQPNKENIKEICINYLEGLEWVFKYYTNGCPNWKWKYNYSYPPLVKDLVKYVPREKIDLIKSDSLDNKPFTPYLQLAYVLPRLHLSLLPLKIHNYLLENYSDYYPIEYTFKWAFCRYFWEAHPILPDINIHLLEKLELQFYDINSLLSTS